MVEVWYLGPHCGTRSSTYFLLSATYVWLTVAKDPGEYVASIYALIRLDDVEHLPGSV